MKKFGRLNGLKAERGKRANKRDARFAQGVVKFAASKRHAPKTRHIWRKFMLRREFAPLNFTRILVRR